MTFLFDLDGTICDTEEGVTKSALFAFETLGLPAPDPHLLRAFIGPPLKDSFLACGLSDQVAQRAIAVFRQRYNTVGKLECRLYPGLMQLFDALAQKGRRLCVATSKLEGPAREILENHGVADFFEIVQGSTPDGTLSEKADIITAVLKRLPPGEPAYMIGDTHFDILGAKKAGIASIAVGYGFGLEKDLLQADYHCATVAQLTELLLSL